MEGGELSSMSGEAQDGTRTQRAFHFLMIEAKNADIISPRLCQFPLPSHHDLGGMRNAYSIKTDATSRENSVVRGSTSTNDRSLSFKL